MNHDPLQEFDDGVAFWATRRHWPQDLHNTFYAERRAVTDGTFSSDWWAGTRRRLHGWRATRGIGRAELDRRFEEHRAALVEVWRTVIEPRLSADITSVSWEDVKALPQLAGQIKPTKSNSGVFPSKLSHFIAPRLFPVLDKTALPGGQYGYASYFALVQEMWDNTAPDDREALQDRLSTLIKQRSGGSMVNGYPVVNKIVELRLIGRHHASG